MPDFFAMSRIVVRPNPIFWKSWSETSRIFFFVASFLVSRLPMVLLFSGRSRRRSGEHGARQDAEAHGIARLGGVSRRREAEPASRQAKSGRGRDDCESDQPDCSLRGEQGARRGADGAQGQN